MELLDMDLGTDRHFEEEVLESYSRGTLSGKSLVRLEEHLLTCEACRQRLEQNDEYVLAMRTALAAGHSTPQPAFNFLTFWRPALLFAAVLALAVVFVIRRGPAPNGVETPVAVSLQALRGPSVSAEAPAGRVLLLTPDVSGLRESPWFRLEIVGATGDSLWSGRVSQPRFQTQAPALRTGDYFVRVYSSSGELLREYGLKTR
jgi:hypothetical protein